LSLSTDLSVGSELLGYRIEDVLGRGGMGVVYLAEDRRLKRKVALKLLAPRLAGDERFGERLLAESELAASLDHPNIVPVYEAGEADGRIFIAMRYVEGPDLRRLLRDGPLGPEKTLPLVSQVASALDAAHAQGLVHRDVKPSNVLIAPEGGHEGSDHVYLADFGLSRRLAEQSRYGEGRSLGTVDYVAPEQIRGEQVDGRADLYSLGCLLYECLAGRPPFSRHTDTEVLFAHLEEEPPSFPGLEGVFGRALAKSPAERFQSGRELVDAARGALGLAAPRRSRLAGALAAVGVLLLAVALVAVLLTRGGGGVPAEPGADSLVRIDPVTNRVTETMPVGRSASGVAADGRYVWVTNAGDGTVWRIDPQAQTVLRLAAHGTPTSVTIANGQAVVGDGPEHTVATFDVATGALRYATALSGVSTGPGASDYGELRVAAGPAGAWLADPLAGGIVGRVDDTLSSLSTSPSVQVTIPPGETNLDTAYYNFDGLTVGDGAVWVAGDPFGRTVWRVDPTAARVVATIRLPFIPAGIAAGEGGVWVTSLLGDAVSRIDPATNRIVSTIPVGRVPTAIATGDGAVWVTSAIDDAVWRIDPRTNRVVARIPLRGAPGHLTVGAGGVWVSVSKPAVPPPARAIKIGVYADCTGPYNQFYSDSVGAAELPLVERGGRPGAALTDGVSGVSVGGRPVRLYFGCATTNQVDSFLEEARRLVEKVGVAVLIGPTDTPEELALQQYARRHPAVAFLDGSGDAPIASPAPDFYNFHPDALQWIAGLGDYAYRQLGWRTAVTITDPVIGARFSWGQSAAFTAEFCSLGGTIVKRIWIPSGTTDLSGIVAQLPRSGVGGVFVSGFDTTGLALASGYPQLHGNVSRRMVVASLVMSPTLLRRLGARASGLVTGGPYPVVPTAFLPRLLPSSRFVIGLHRLVPRFPVFFIGGAFDVPYYNAMSAALEALDHVHGDLLGGERRFMAALARVRLQSPVGPIRLDATHRAIAPSYVWQLQGPHLVARIIRTIPNVDPTFGGYFRPTDPAPGETTPACKRRTPPPWAR
jgi:DNA-binding beta-propeller fold protein YncE/ABC-type branched-subunit amino acid transport system substrate-binding protein